VNVTSWIALGLLIAAAALTVWRTVKPGSSVGDRAVGFDMLTALIQCSLFVGAVIMADGLLVDVALVLGLLGFLTSVTVARFVERTSG
jgi:multicomponent Na+:H+ antiporter subunit F